MVELPIRTYSVKWPRSAKSRDGERVTLEDKRQLRLAASCNPAKRQLDLLYNAAEEWPQGDCLFKSVSRHSCSHQHRMVSPELLRLPAGKDQRGANTAQL